MKVTVFVADMLFKWSVYSVLVAVPTVTAEHTVEKRQLKFDLGGFFGQPTNRQGGGQTNSGQRINLGDLAGSFLGGFVPKQGNKNNNDPLNGIISGLVSTAGNVLSSNDLSVGLKDGALQVSILPTFPKECRTTSGPDNNAKCALPFTYKNVKYTKCTLTDSADGTPWCSTLTDTAGNHVGGQGKYGPCSPQCEKLTAVEVTGGDYQNSGLTNIPWFPSDGKLVLPGVAGGNRILSLGLDQPNLGHGSCRSTISGTGTCRHLNHCVQPEFFDFLKFLSNVCIINNRFIGVCCPNSAQPPQATSTTTPTTSTAANIVVATTVAAPGEAFKGCGTNAKKFQTRIVGGKPADPNDWPWLAALVLVNGQGTGQYCGATLVSDTHVLTAAHCLQPFQKDDIRVKLGEYNFKVEGETADKIFRVAEVKIHEQYSNVTYENDIAILRLETPVTRSKSIYPICLPDASDDFTNKRAFVIGWGTIYFGGPQSDVLQEVNIRVWDQESCVNNYKKIKRDVTETMMCAGEVARDSCQGDSGGPLNCQDPDTGDWKLCGIVSWGAKCAEPDYPGVYTRVTRFLDWINNNMFTPF